MECLLPYLCMVTVPHIMVELERMLDYRGVRLVRFHCNLLSRTSVICHSSVYQFALLCGLQLQIHNLPSYKKLS